MNLRRINPRRFTREPRLRPLSLSQLMALPGMRNGSPLPLSVEPVGAASTAIIVRPGNPTDGVNYVDKSNLPLFADPISIHDGAQRQVSDCWELAADNAVALMRPDDLRKIIVEESKGVYRVRFIRAGVETWVYTDGMVPDNGVFVTRCLWPAVLEKACAYYRRGFNTYASLNFGFNYAAFQDLGYSVKTYAANAAGWAAAATALASGWPVAIGTTTTIPPGVPLISNHSHTLVSITADGKTATFYNPWGFDGTGSDSDPSDGTVTILVAAASPAITLITVCYAFTPPLPFAAPTPAPTPTNPPEVTMPPTAVITSIDHTAAKKWDLVSLQFTISNGTPTLSIVPPPWQPAVIDSTKGTASFFMPDGDVTITLACTDSTNGNTAQDVKRVTLTPTTPPVTPNIPAPTARKLVKTINFYDDKTFEEILP